VSRAAFPYIRAAPDDVRADAWLLTNGDDVREAPPYLDGWDYNTELRLSREIRIDVEALRRSTSIDAASTLALSITAFSTTTWIRKSVFRRTLTSADEELTVEVQLPGDDLGGNLRLTSGVVLTASAKTATPFVAHRPGSVLWADTHEIRLQGDAPLFPISVIDFERAGFAGGAGWHLEIGSDLTAPIHASLRLYLNNTDSVVVAAFANAASPRPEDQAVMRAIYADVARIMVEHALNEAELRSDTLWDESTLGFALRALLLRFFPHGEDLEAIRARRIEHPSDFSTELLAGIGVFR
jgi:hypothetical protein